LYLTEIDAEIADADTFFPEINREEWEIINQSEIKEDPRTGTQFRFTCLSRK
jgi:dihydrofolate reductase